jgi:hypothetical protein
MGESSRPKINVNWPHGYGPESKSPEFDAGEGWRVLDADGNVVASGGISVAQADGRLAGLIAQASTEGEQE